MTDTTKPQRLLSLDILRGITIAGMILVNNPGSWEHIYTPLDHAEWCGLTPTDLVFPFFMFIMGVSTYFSLRKYNFSFSKATLLKILRRTVVIFAIGLFLAWFGLTLKGAIKNGMSIIEAATQFDSVRILGVMPRLALCYGIGSIIALALRGRKLAWCVAAILIIYAIMLIVGHGWDFNTDNILYRADMAVLGSNHMYKAHETINGVTMQFEPEGLLSTIPSIAHMLIGFLCGGLIVKTTDNNRRMNSLFIVGTILTFAGLLLSYGIPISKKIWSPTFVLTTCGMAASLLALLIWIIDVKGHKTWCRFFEAFGVNPLFMYCLGAALTYIFIYVRIPVTDAPDGIMSLGGFIYERWLTPLCCGHLKFASALYAILFVGFNWCIGYILYRKRIYIKI